MEMMKIGLFAGASSNNPIFPGIQSLAGFKGQFEARDSGILIPTPSEPINSLVVIPPRKEIHIAQYNRARSLEQNLRDSLVVTPGILTVANAFA